MESEEAIDNLEEALGYLEEILDLFAFRVVVDNVGDCYNVLVVVHDLYKPILGRFKDYIGTPKPNGYQSLHTSVIGHLFLSGQDILQGLGCLQTEELTVIGIDAVSNLLCFKLNLIREAYLSVYTRIS